MKKILMLAVLAFCVCSLAACGKKEPKPVPTATAKPEAAPVESVPAQIEVTKNDDSIVITVKDEPAEVNAETGEEVTDAGPEQEDVAADEQTGVQEETEVNSETEETEELQKIERKK